MLATNQCADQRPVDFAAVHRVTTAAEEAGWPTRSAFEAAMLLLVFGVSVAEAEAMFEHCRRWLQ